MDLELRKRQVVPGKRWVNPAPGISTATHTADVRQNPLLEQMLWEEVLFLLWVLEKPKMRIVPTLTTFSFQRSLSLHWSLHSQHPFFDDGVEVSKVS